MVLHYQNLSYAPEIVKAELTSKHLNDTLASGLESKKPVDWPKILLAIIMTFDLLWWSTKCLFLPIRKATAMVRFSSPQLTHKNSILYYKAVKVTINIPNFAEVNLNVVVCCHNLLDLLLPIETFSNIFICNRGLLDSVVTNSGTLYFLKLIIIILLSMHQ